MEPVDIAWAAGLFEGEGCITTFEQSHNALPLIRLQIIMTDRDVLERFCLIVNCGRVSDERRFGREHYKPTYVWQIGNRFDVERILLAFKPWLCQRRGAKADLVLAEIARLDRNCKNCGIGFRATRMDMQCCSVQCRNRWNYLKNRPAVRPSKVGRPRSI